MLDKLKEVIVLNSRIVNKIKFYKAVFYQVNLNTWLMNKLLNSLQNITVKENSFQFCTSSFSTENIMRLVKEIYKIPFI